MTVATQTVGAVSPVVAVNVTRPQQSPGVAGIVVRVLAEDKLELFADRVQTRMLEGREEKGRTPEGVLKQQQKYSDFVQRNGQPFQAFLDKSGGPTCSCLNPVFGNLHSHALCCVAL